MTSWDDYKTDNYELHMGTVYFYDTEGNEIHQQQLSKIIDDWVYRKIKNDKK